MKYKTLTDNLQDLPKWAQTEVETLQMRLRAAKNEINRLNDNPESNTLVGFNSTHSGEQLIYLRNNQMITFCLPDGEVTAQIKKDSLEISTSGFSKGDMYIRPQVSNVVQIHLK